MDKRYQIFVSSTYEDLKEERKAVIESILQMKHIPAGMELFSASNDEQFEYIKKIIDNCDYYILIIAGRYGSVNPKTKMSYTEQEYEYALEKNIPILVFLHNDIDNLPPEKKDDRQEELRRLIAKVSENRLCKLWNNIGELRSSTIISLMEQFSGNPQAGWKRGDDVNNTELLEQINRLRIEKEDLQKENNLLLKKVNEFSTDISDLAEFTEKFEITGKVWVSGSSYSRGYYKIVKKTLTWNEIFSLIAPFLMHPMHINSFKSQLGTSLDFSVGTIDFDNVQTIKIQFISANLIKVYSAKTVDGGYGEFVILTEKGLQYLKELKTVKTSKF